MSKSRSVKALVRDICAHPARGGKKAPTMKRSGNRSKAPIGASSENTTVHSDQFSPAMCLAVAKMTDQPGADHNARLVMFCRRARKARRARAARFERMMAESGMPITLRYAAGSAAAPLPKGLTEADKRFLAFARRRKT